MSTIPQVGVPATTTFLDWRTITNQVIDTLNVNLVGSPTLMQSMRDVFNYIESAGVHTGCGITDNANGTVDVAAGEALLRSSDVEGAELFSVVVPASAAVALTDNDLNYIYADYNAGTPVVSVTTNSALITGNDICLIAIISREVNSLTILEAQSEMNDQHNKLNNMLVETEGFKHVLGGTQISESGTRRLQITSGSFYRGLNKYAHNAYDTNAADTFEYYYRDGVGGWTEVSLSTAIDNTKFDDGSGTLATLTADNFVVNWLYLKVGSNKSELFSFYGQGEYTTIAEAQTESAPTGLPAQLDELGVLIGRVILEQNSTTLNITESAFGTQFKAGQSLAHNNMSGMQGGAQDEYYHLDAAEHTAHLAHVLDTTDNNPHGLTPAGIGAEVEGTSVAMALALG